MNLVGIGEERGTGKQSFGYGGRGGGTIEGGRLGVNVGYRGRVGGKSLRDSDNFYRIFGDFSPHT